MSRIVRKQVICPRGHEFMAQLHDSINTQLSPEAVSEFLEGRLNRPECPTCHQQVQIMTPVLFNDMEREFMVWVGCRNEADGHVEREEGLTSVVYAADYSAALAALVAFRAKPENAEVAYEEMNEEKARTYIENYLRIYRDLKAARVRSLFVH